MNIVLIHYAAPPVVGGVEAVMARHARLMADAGHRVCIIAGRGAQIDPRIAFLSISEVDSRNPEVLAIKADLDAGRVPPLFEPLVERLVSRLKAALVGADWVIAHNVCSLHKNLALTAALYRLSKDFTRPRFILWHHDLAWTAPHYRRELHDGYPWDLLRVDWPWAKQVVVSEQRRQELAALLSVPLARIRVIPNGVDEDEFLKLDAVTKGLARRFALTHAAPLLLLPVRITPRKNIALALRLLAALRERFPEAMLLVTGPLGPHNPANQQYFSQLLDLRRQLHLKESAIFLADAMQETVPDSVIADLYKLADLLFLPSQQEGFGIPVLEAGLAGIPVFCSDIPALRELGASDVRYFSPDADPAALAREVARVLDASPVYRLRKRVLSQFTWEDVYNGRIAPLLQEG